MSNNQSQKKPAGKNGPEKNTPPTPLADFTEWQSLLPQKLGVSLDIIRQLRDDVLTEGTDWMNGADGHVVMTIDAVERLAGKLTQHSGAGEPEGAKTGDLTQHEVAMVVEKYELPNARVILARIVATQELVTVRVKRKDGLRRGTEIKGRHVAGTIYEICGPIPKARA